MHKIDIYSKLQKTYSHNGITQIIKYIGMHQVGPSWWSNTSKKEFIIKLMNDGTIYIKNISIKKEEKLEGIDDVFYISHEINVKLKEPHQSPISYFTISGDNSEVPYLTTKNNITYELKNFELKETEHLLTNSIYDEIICTINYSVGVKCNLLIDGTVDIHTLSTNKIDKIPKMNDVIQILTFRHKIGIIMLTKYGEIYYYNGSCVHLEIKTKNKFIIEIIIKDYVIYALDNKNNIYILRENDSDINIIKLKDTIDDIW